MTRDEIKHAKTAYNCAVSVLRAAVARLVQDHDLPPTALQRALDMLRSLEQEIEHWNPTPDDEGGSQ